MQNSSVLVLATKPSNPIQTTTPTINPNAASEPAPQRVLGVLNTSTNQLVIPRFFIILPGKLFKILFLSVLFY
jgi:hypothetical protein